MADQQLVSIVDRVTRLMEEKRSLQNDIKDILTEAKSAGYNPKAVRLIVRQRMETATQTAARIETQDDLELMLAALGEYGTTPLGETAINRARADA